MQENDLQLSDLHQATDMTVTQTNANLLHRFVIT